MKVEQVDGLRSMREGKVRCIDCHQVYSARNPRNLRGDKQEACLACHPQYRGPFMFQHGAANEAISDGCLTCHLPHGSPNRSLLKRPDRSLCLACHADRFDHNDFPGFTCVTSGCHSDIHGSNQNRLLIPGGSSLGVSRSGLATPRELLDRTTSGAGLR
jgi:predicted CXXCH cytochrome family protein